MDIIRFATGSAVAILLGAGPLRAHSVSEEMAEAAHHWLAALGPERRSKAQFTFANQERGQWHFVPQERRGVSLKEMSPAQRHLAAALLSTALSQRGLLKAHTIMSLEEILLELERGSGPVRDSELYFVTVFGEPKPESAWGWRFEGHHLSLNFTVVPGGDVAVAPSFFGSNPGKVGGGARAGLRVLGAEEDFGRQLVRSLTEAQRRQGVLPGAAPADIIQGPGRRAALLTPAGLSAAQLDREQAQLLNSLVEEYVHRYRQELAEEDLRKIREAGPSRLFFAWAGGLEAGDPHYYRVQGSHFVLEYDNTQNNANHIHTVWRDLQNDFGEDLLRRHYEQTPHARP